MIEILINSGFVIAGLLLLYFGGDYLVKGAGGIALKFKIPPLVVGLTIVAFGTSAPELFVSLISALQGYTDISLGNVVGSNTMNIALILGISSLILVIPVSRGIIRRDMPLMFLSYAVMIVVSLPFGGVAVISRIEGLVMVAAIVAYVLFLYSSATHGGDVDEVVEMDAVDADEAGKPLAILLLFTVGGIFGLAYGSDLLIDGASWMARNLFGASDRFIGITIVAFGTSLPELVTSVVAASKKQMDISVGNIIGSNIFNSLMVLGATALISPLAVDIGGFTWDLVVMLAVSLFLLLVSIFRKQLGKVTGVLFLTGYAAYFVYLLAGKSL